MSTLTASLWGDIAETILAQTEDFGTKSPHVTRGENWDCLNIDDVARWNGEQWGHGNWTCGFWPAILWLVYRHVPNSTIRLYAEKASARLFHRMDDLNTHDIGFIFSSGIVEAYRSTHEEIYKTVALHAAQNLASRLQPGGYIAAWGPLTNARAIQTSTIDTMMNLPLLWWAGEVSNQPNFTQVATSHALLTSKVYFREDNSTYHCALFNSQTGDITRRGTFQGSEDESCWSRGQAWAIAGFAEAFFATGLQEFRDSAERAISYYLSHVSDIDPIPLWDFHAGTDAPRDTSAAAIASFGILKLGFATQSAQLVSEGIKIINVLNQKYRRKPGLSGLLDHAAYSVPQNLGVDEAVVWGDYFYLKSLDLISTTYQ